VIELIRVDIVRRRRRRPTVELHRSFRDIYTVSTAADVDALVSIAMVMCFPSAVDVTTARYQGNALLPPIKQSIYFPFVTLGHVWPRGLENMSTSFSGPKEATDPKLRVFFVVYIIICLGYIALRWVVHFPVVRCLFLSVSVTRLAFMTVT